MPFYTLESPEAAFLIVFNNDNGKVVGGVVAIDTESNTISRYLLNDENKVEVDIIEEVGFKPRYQKIQGDFTVVDTRKCEPVDACRIGALCPAHKD